MNRHMMRIINLCSIITHIRHIPVTQSSTVSTSEDVLTATVIRLSAACHNLVAQQDQEQKVGDKDTFS